jgi:Rap1a immunity proteins
MSGVAMRSILAFFICAATVGQANAQPSGKVTGKMLFDLCSSGGANAARFSCDMYIKGFLDGYSARETKMCFENLTVGEAAAAFVRIWRSIEARKGAANMGPVADAPSEYAFTALMMDAYPCKPSR